MEVFEGHRALIRPLVSPAIALGNFDGVHRGHQALFAAAARAAATLGGDAVVFTFDPHPAAVLAPTLAPKTITPLRRRLELIAEHGIDVCVVEPFTRELASLAPEAFARGILVGVLGARHIVVGYDFTFGKNRAGNTELLARLGGELGFAVEVIEPVEVDGVLASSSAVRELVSAGDLAGARHLLGRDFDVEGLVVEGEKRGRELGFPTANVVHGSELLPPIGIYATRVTILESGASYLAATSLGTNPTFIEGGAAPKVTLEAYLLDFDGDLYGSRLRVEFVEYLRPELRFSSMEALIEAIESDVGNTRRVLGKKEAI